MANLLALFTVLLRCILKSLINCVTALRSNVLELGLVNCNGKCNCISEYRGVFVGLFFWHFTVRIRIHKCENQEEF